MRIAVAGSGRLGTSVLLPLLDSDHDVVAIIQDGRQTKGLKRKLAWLFAPLSMTAHSMNKIARRERLPVVYIDKMSEEELAPLAALAPDIVLVSGFAIILKPPLLNLPRVGCVNMHSSLLPRHRGPNPFTAVILAGETESGVTFHVMEEGIDTGDILDQSRFEVSSTDAMVDVYQRACARASERVVPLMDRIDQEGLKGTPQDSEGASYDKKVKPEDAWVDWNQPAQEIERMVRALAPTVMPRFKYGRHTVYIARAQFKDDPVDDAPGTVLRNRGTAVVATGRGTLKMQVAFVRTPVPWIWPSPWLKPEIGERLL
jgi:methionyl-tRNA formyltransferase